jgi:Protein of unknown function (DUF4231)
MPRTRSYTDEVKRTLTEVIDSLDGLAPLQRDFLTRRWLDQVIWMEGAAAKAQRRYYRLRLVTVVGAVIIPALVSLELGGDTDRAVSWLTFAVSLVVAASAAVEEFFHFGERWRHYRRTVEQLKAEGWLFFELVGDYGGGPDGHRDAFGRFAARVEGLLREDVEVYVTRVVRERKQQESDE